MSDPHGRGRSGPSDGASRFDAARFMMGLFLLSLAMLFAGGAVFAIALRFSPHGGWQGQGPGRIPIGLWLSTLLILVSSGTMLAAQRAARRAHAPALQRWISLTFALGLAFLASQVVVWLMMVRGGLVGRGNLFAGLFYTLTGLHALHVLGGLVPLGISTVNAHRKPPAQVRYGLSLLAMYWHFLDVVWLLLLLVIMIVA